MRHRMANVKLGRTASHRNAMLRNMVTSLLEHGRIVTTIHKAKAVRPLVDKMIGLAKKGKVDLHSFRQAAAVITKRTVLDKIFEEAASRYSDRACGYTIMVKSGLRKGDAATMVILELIKPGTAKATVGGGITTKKAQSGDRSKRVAQSAGKVVEEKIAPVDAAPVDAVSVDEPQPEESQVDRDSSVAGEDSTSPK